MSTDQTTEGTEAPKRSGFEGVKEASRWLRGTLAEELAQPTDHFSDDAKNLLKFHGSYQQEDRDARKNRAKTGVSKHYMCMIRLKLPGGKMNAQQFLAMDALSEQYGNSTLRFTTRQSIQFHYILKSNLRATIRGINDTLLSTLGGCGDVNRNVMACPAPLGDPVRKEMQQLAGEIATHLAPRSHAYHDIWLNGEHLSPDAAQEEGVEPIYGKVYLPRKFKIGLALPTDNCIDVHAQDLGFLAVIENGRTIGYNVLVGGGMGRTHGNANTFPHLGQGICFVEPNEVVAASEAVIKFFRDHGNRADRKRARIKYVVHDWGVEKVREVLARDYFGKPIRLPRDVTITDVDLHLGWHPQGDGKWFLGLNVENGRLKDEGSLRMRAGVRSIVQQFNANVRLSGQQDILLCDIETASRGAIDRLLSEHGIPRPENLSMVRKWSMACPAIPTCGLAISESERALPGIVDALEPELKELGLENERISIRMTGCPNGCARPYQSEIGIVGRSGDKYMLFLGGSTLGYRLNETFQDLVPRDKVIPLLKKVLGQFKECRTPGESFGDYCTRMGIEKLCEIAGVEKPKHGKGEKGEPEA
ncbi:MAG: NADPH-dependent assimilatory sulfite reductase hemoprotein subunit [Planctomycetes bacterium]|nr:NADPH-dependent assimilatory sulfite reductase hemoprotein subunit [Planctomycetota bacterium]